MLHYDRNDISKGTDLAETSNSKKCMICLYWFLNHGYKFQNSVCNDLTMFSVNISDIAIIPAKTVDYRCIIHNMKIVGIYKKYCLKLQSTQDSFFTFFLIYINWLIVNIV